MRHYVSSAPEKVVERGNMPRISGFVIVKIVLENQADGIINGAERES